MKNRVSVLLLGMAGALMLLAGCSPSGPEELVRGDKLMTEGRSSEAQKAFGRAVELMPREARAWNRLGMACQAGEQTADARRAYRQALQLDRNLAEAHYNLGILELDDGNAAEAERSLKTFLAFEANHAAAWQHLGLAQYQLRLWDAAEISLGKALKIEPSDADALNTLGLVQVARRQFRDAYRSFTLAQKNHPEHAASLLNQAVTAHQHLGDRRTAYQHYQQYLALRPPPPHSDQVVQAIAQLEKQLGIQPKPAPGTNGVAVAKSVATSNVVIHPPAATALVKSPVTGPVPVTNRVATGVPPVPAVAAAATNPATIRRPQVAAPSAAPIPQKSPVVEARLPVANPIPPENRTVAAPEKPVSTPAPVQVTPGEPKAVVVSRPTPAVAQKPSPPAPEPPPQVVVLEREIPLRKAIDVSSPANSAPPVVANTSTSSGTRSLDITPLPSGTPDSEPVSPSAGETLPISGAESVEPPKRSFWRKANPVGWFRKDDKPAETVEPVTKTKDGKVLAKLNPVRWFGRGEKDASAAVAVAPTHPNPPADGGVELRSTVADPGVPPSPPVATVTERIVVENKPPVYPRYVQQWPGAVPGGNRSAADGLVQEGIAAHDRRDMQAALQAFRKAAEVDPSCFEAQHNLAATALTLGDVGVALRASEAATRIRPQSPESRVNFAAALHRNRHVEDAAEQLERILQVTPGNQRVRMDAANLYARELARPADARVHYEAILSAEPNHPQAAAIRQWLENRR